MPLRKGHKRKDIAENIEDLKKSGKSPKQATALAMDYAVRSSREKPAEDGRNGE